MTASCPKILPFREVLPSPALAMVTRFEVANYESGFLALMPLKRNSNAPMPMVAKWDCGMAAQKALTALVASAPQLQCDLIDVDRYGRVVMRCFAGKTDLRRGACSGWAGAGLSAIFVHL